MGESLPNSKGYPGSQLTTGLVSSVPFVERAMHPPKKTLGLGGPAQTTTILSNAPNTAAKSLRRHAKGPSQVVTQVKPAQAAVSPSSETRSHRLP
jgi:hypothetical protein